MTDISVLTYNAHLFQGSVAGLLFQQNYYDEERAAQIISNIKKLSPDFLCLTEVWTQKMIDMFGEGLKEEYPYMSTDDRGWYSQGSGLLFLSKYPIEHCEFVKFGSLNIFDWERFWSSWAGEDGLAEKGFIAATVAMPNQQKVRLLTTHMQADAMLTLGLTGVDEARTVQLREMQNFVNSQSEQMPTFIAGDLNVIAGNAEYDAMMKLMTPFQDAWTAAGHSVTSGNTYLPQENVLIHYFSPSCKDGDDMRLDYILMDPRLKVNHIEVILDWKVEVDGKTMDASDHMPLYGRFSLN